MLLKETYKEDDEIVTRAGLIPFFVKDGKLLMMFMKPSDSKYGGNRWQIAKGQIDKGEDTKKAAIREAKEELGFRYSNSKKLFLGGVFWDGKFTMYGSIVKNQKDFGKPHFETGAVMWLNWGEWFKEGRREQTKIVSVVYKLAKGFM